MNSYRIAMISWVLATAACGGEGGFEERTGETGQKLHGDGSVAYNFVKTADWGTGYNARVDITNAGAAAIRGFSAEFDMPKNVDVNLSSLPRCSADRTDNCWFIFNDIGPENVVRIIQADSNNVIEPGETVSHYLYGDYQGAFGFPTRCAAPHASFFETPVACNASTDSAPPTGPTNVRVFGTGSTVVDLVWDPATDDVGVTGYVIRYATPLAPALEIGEVRATLPVTRARITRLVSDTRYTFFVEARDAAGNVSASASSPATTTRTPAIGTAFRTLNTWPGGGFQGEFRITNNESLPLDHWRVTFSFTGSFQSVWDGALSGGPGTFTISAPGHNLRLDPGETAVVGATGTFGVPPTEPTGFAPGAGIFELTGVRALAMPQPACLGLSCPSGTHCEVPDNGIPTCVPD